jgi:uncharacterized protein YndB with AHSA1/START domain
MILSRVPAALAILLLAHPASAAVVEVAASGFLVTQEVSISAQADKVYSALVHDIGRWWNPDHTYSKDSKNLSIDGRPGGCFCERLGPDAGVEHMRVTYIQPNKELRLSGALGPLQASGLAGSLTWKLTGTEYATTLSVSYSVGGYMQGGFEKMAPAVDGVVGNQVQRLKAFIEGRKLP